MKTLKLDFINARSYIIGLGATIVFFWVNLNCYFYNRESNKFSSPGPLQRAGYRHYFKSVVVTLNTFSTTHGQMETYFTGWYRYLTSPTRTNNTTR